MPLPLRTTEASPVEIAPPAASPDPATRALVAECHDLPDSRVRIEAARHPALPLPVLVGLLDHPDRESAGAAAAYPAPPVAVTVRRLPPSVLPGPRGST
ncbi:hypothetical protein [Streptomyces sp. NPDC008125]|uniref:hypothetical protein n=1 Tax=Streptomyces sp. NPDC008125 TaxID=3364811 RepID=UPI0036ECD404